MTDYAEAIDELGTMGSALWKNSDELNVKFNEITKMLNDKKVSISAWTDSIIYKEGDSVEYKLGYCKINDEWQLACRKYFTNDSRPAFPVSLVTVRRELRIEAAKYLNELLNILKLKLEKYNADVEDALSNIDGAKNNI